MSRMQQRIVQFVEGWVEKAARGVGVGEPAVHRALWRPARPIRSAAASAATRSASAIGQDPAAEHRTSSWRNTRRAARRRRYRHPAGAVTISSSELRNSSYQSG